MPKVSSKALTKRALAQKKSRPRGGKPTEPLQTVIPAGFAFVLKKGDRFETAEWRYLAFEYGDTLGTTPMPMMVFPEITPAMHSFWKRVVIDGSFQTNESNMWLKTLRLVEVHLSLKDVTEQLFGDDDMHRDAMRLGALAKLSPQEAKLLGLETEYTMLRIIQGGPSQSDDQNLADKLRHDQEELGVNRID